MHNWWLLSITPSHGGAVPRGSCVFIHVHPCLHRVPVSACEHRGLYMCAWEHTPLLCVYAFPARTLETCGLKVAPGFCDVYGGVSVGAGAESSMQSTHLCARGREGVWAPGGSLDGEECGTRAPGPVEPRMGPTHRAGLRLSRSDCSTS